MRQKWHLHIGDEGCYFLSLIMWAERITRREFNDLTLYAIAIERGWMQPDCFMDAPEKFLGYLTDGEWTVQKTVPSIIPRPEDVVIERWGWKRTMKETAHFKPPWGDPLGESETVKNGELVSLRIFRRIA